MRLLIVSCATLLLASVGPVSAKGIEGYEATEHYYAMGVQIERCIGCGLCVKACKVENDVPREPFFYRTWVERYRINEEGEALVDSPDGGISGFPPSDDEDATVVVASGTGGHVALDAAAEGSVYPGIDRSQKRMARHVAVVGIHVRRCFN